MARDYHSRFEIEQALRKTGMSQPDSAKMAFSFLSMEDSDGEEHSEGDDGIDEVELADDGSESCEANLADFRCEVANQW